VNNCCLQNPAPGKLPLPEAGTPGTSVCLPVGPAWRTTAFAPDGLCREPSPPARSDGYGEKLSFSHRIFAASRLRVKSVISARPASRTLRPTTSRMPAHPCGNPHEHSPGRRQRSQPGRSGPRAADQGASRGPEARMRHAGCRTRIAHSPQRSTNRRTATNLFGLPLCLRG
jgi:hypothetical protein